MHAHTHIHAHTHAHTGSAWALVEARAEAESGGAQGGDPPSQPLQEGVVDSGPHSAALEAATTTTTTPLARPGDLKLRFDVGDCVFVRDEQHLLHRGRVVAHWYHDDEWPAGMIVPFLVQVSARAFASAGVCVYVPCVGVCVVLVCACEHAGAFTMCTRARPPQCSVPAPPVLTIAGSW